MKDNTGGFSSLAGQVLIAMPNMDDDRFERAVIFIASHTPESGAVGLVINKPAKKMTLEEILTQLNIPHTQTEHMPDIMLGGPAQQTRGFILHSNEYHNKTSLPVRADVSVNTSQDILTDIVSGKGPRNVLIALGCATWISGQLEEEIMSNLWLTGPADMALLFEVPYASRWEKAFHDIGVDTSMLANDFGKA